MGRRPFTAQDSCELVIYIIWKLLNDQDTLACPVVFNQDQGFIEGERREGGGREGGRKGEHATLSMAKQCVTIFLNLKILYKRAGCDF